MSDDGPKSRRDEAVDAQLRRAFAALTDQELPDRFSDLLRKLRLDETDGGATTDADGRLDNSDREQDE